MLVWKHVFHVFFVSFIAIILTTCSVVCAIKPLLGRFTMKFIVAFKSLVFSDRSTPLLEVAFSF